jgi:hypothetical protein
MESEAESNKNVANTIVTVVLIGSILAFIAVAASLFKK